MASSAASGVSRSDTVTPCPAPTTSSTGPSMVRFTNGHSKAIPSKVRAAGREPEMAR
jgi:hypothetical protein